MKARRILAFILALTILMGNTMSVSATSSTVSGNEIVDLETETEIEEESITENVENSVSNEKQDEFVGEEIETDEIDNEDEKSLEEIADADDEKTVSGNEVIDETADEEEQVMIDIPVVNYSISATSTEIERPAVSWTLEGLGAPAVPSDENAEWDGPIVILGDTKGTTYTSAYASLRETFSTYWRLIDTDEAVIMADGIFQNVSAEYDQTTWENTKTYSYLNGNFKSEEPFTGSSSNAIKSDTDIRIPTLDEITNPAYGYVNSSDASATRKYGLEYPIMPENGEGSPYYCAKDGSIATSIDGNCYAYVPTMQLDTSKILLAVEKDLSTGAFGPLPATAPWSNVYQLFLKNESDFAATLPMEGNQKESITFSVDASGGAEYNKLYVVLSIKATNEIVAFGAADQGVGVGEKSFYLSSDFPAGNYTLTVFEAKWDGCYTSAYAGTPVSTDFVVNGPSISDFEVSDQQYGSIKLHWTMDNLPDDGTLSYTRCNIYRAESEDGEYQLIEKEYLCNNGYSTHSYTDEKEVFDQNGSNKTFYYKICIVTNGIESEYYKYATNAGMYYGPADGEYKGMYFAVSGDDKSNTLTQIDSLFLRPEEYKELQVVLFDENGNTVIDAIESDDAWWQDSTSWYICTEPVMDSADALNSEDKKVVSDTLLEIVPIDFGDEIHVGIVAHDTVEAGQVYYLMAQRQLPNKETYWAQIPISIVASQAGDVFDKMPNGENGIYLSADQLSSAIRADMVARKAKGVYYVSDAVYQAWIEDGGTDAVYDFNREREGMKPYEGDYLFWQNFDPEKIMSFTEDQWVFEQEMFNGVWWNKIASKQVYFTTAAKEEAVTNKINALLKTPGGDLYGLYSAYYDENGNYSVEERKYIADELCDYVHENTTYKGTPIPQYHSAWSAIINKIGTCQAYSLYLTRLLREFGIATKILTGTDKNYHTYNIVQIDAENDIWYYYDATGGIKYQTESEFGRTAYQDLFLEDPLFVENYISKIAGSPYAPQVYLYADETEIGQYFTVETAADALIADNVLDDDKDTKYRVELKGDADFGNGNLILPESVAYCELDLNGHTLTVRNGARLALDKVCDGTIYMTIGSSMYVYAPENNAQESVYGNVKFNYEQANGGFYVKNQKYYAEGKTEEEGEEEGTEENTEKETEPQIYLKNVQVSDNRAAEFTGLVHMDEKSSLVTAWLSLDNEESEIPACQMGIITADTVNMIRGHFDINKLSSAGEVEIRNASILNIYGDVSFGNTLINEWASGSSANIFINIMQAEDGSGNVNKKGAITFNGKLSYKSTSTERGCYAVMSKQQVTVDSNGNMSEPRNIKFDSGETIVTVKKEASYIPTEYFMLANADEDEQIIRKGNKLVAARITVKVSYTDAVTGEETVKEYISLEEAVANLKTDFKEKAGSYTVTFTDNTKLNGSVTFPAFVKELHLKAEGKNDTDALLLLDLGGYSISAGAVVNVHNNLHITNTAQTVSKVTTTAKNGENGYAVNILQTESANVEHLSNISLSVANGTVLFANATENETISQIHIADVVITAKEVNVASGKWKLGTVNATTFMNEAVVYADAIKNVTTLCNKADSVLVVDTYTQKTTGKTNLEADSELAILTSGTFYNTVLGGTDTEAGGLVYVYAAEDSNIAFETKVSAVNDNVKMSFGHILADTPEQLLTDAITVSPIAPRTKIFTSKINAFPVDLVEVKQPADSAYSGTYEEVYQDSTGIYVGREWITIYTKQLDGEEEPMKTFIRWSDAAAYLNTLANTPMEYVVEIAEDIEMTTALMLPAKVKGITFRGTAIESVDENGEPVASRIDITYTGDLKLLSDTTFENVNLIAKKYNSKKKIYEDYKSALNLNGKVLTLDDVEADFTSISGNAKAYLYMTDSDISVTKTVSSLGFLVMDNSYLEAVGNIAVTDTLTMMSSELVSSAAISLKNVISSDANNAITYGGNGSKNILTITGNVISDDESQENVYVSRTETDAEGNAVVVAKQATARKNAIRISVKSLEGSGYSQAALLCNAAKAGAGWFVVGTEWDEKAIDDEMKTIRVISYATYKKGNAIYCGETVENVKLYSYNPVENSGYVLGEEADYVWESSFATLQEAFSEIDKLALNDRYYLVEVKADDKNVVTFDSKALTFPAKTKGILVSASGKDATANIYFKGAISLKSDVFFDGIVFVPTTATGMSLGNYELTLSGCDVDTSKAAGGFNKFSGSGVTGTSALTLIDTDLSVTGAVNGIGTLVYAENTMEDELQTNTTMQPRLKANGAIAVGDVVLKTDGELVGLATVARKNGVVTKVTPQITISGEVYSGTKNAPNNEKTLYLDLQEVVSKKYVSLDFDKSEMENILESGLMIAKAVNVTYPNIQAMQRTGEEDSLLVKSAGYLTYFEGGYGVELSFRENGQDYVIPCRTFADAVTEINNRKSKRDYIITLTEDMAEISGADQNSSIEVPKALSMPNKNYVNLLTIQADPDTLVVDEVTGKNSIESTQLGFLNNITLTGNVILDNVQFVQMVKVDSAYKKMDVAKDNYPAAMTLNTAGFELSIVGDVTFNTPLILNGGSKGVLSFDENGTITTLTNDYTGGEEKNVIYGTVTSFASLNLNDVDLVINEYRSSRTSSKYAAVGSSITTVNMYESTITIAGDHAKGAFSNTNLNMDNSSLVVGGKVNLKNVTLEGDQKATISADTDFNITGTLTSRTNNAQLTTRLKGSGKAPYLNISGTVVRVDGASPICVEVYSENGALVKEHVTLTNAPKVTAQLLTAKNGAARDFIPHKGNYSGGEYSVTNTKGYMMFKSGSNIYVYSGSQVYAAVYTGEELVGYYPSQKDAVAAINALKDKTQDYTIVLMQENGTVASPVSITVPSYASKVTIRSLNEESEKIYLSGSITLNAKTVLENLTFVPVNKGKATTFSISAGNYDLTLTDVETSNGDTTSGTAALKDISGKGKQTITWDSPALTVAGSINSAAKLIVNKDARVNGTLKVTTLQMNNAVETAENGDESDTASAVTLTAKGTVSIGNVENNGTVQNVIVFGRNSKNVTNLTINKEINNENALLLLKQTEGSKVGVVSKNGYKVALGDAKKLAVMPLASTDSFEVAEKEDSQVVVKAGKGIYLADDTAIVDMVALTRTAQDGKITEINCLDYTQAISEINNLADRNSDYVIELATGADASVGADSNITDANPYGAFPMPSSNKAKSVKIVGTVDPETNKPTIIMNFTGGISGYGTVTIQNVMLKPVKGSADKTSVDAKISLLADKTTETPSLTLVNVNTFVQTAETASTKGFIASISGTKNKTNVILRDCGNLIMNSGISNVDELTITGTKLLSGGESTVNTTVLDSNTSWDSLGKLTTNYVTMPVDNTAYIGIKQDKYTNPQFVLNNDVNEGGLLICKVYGMAATLADDETIFAGTSENEVDSYKSVSLVSAKKASADKVRAYTFRPANVVNGAFADGDAFVSENKLISYKVGAYVRNGNMDDMAVRVKQYDGMPLEGDENLLSSFYAESIDACTTIINNIADVNSYYDIEFIQAPADGENQVVIVTTKNGTAYGAWTLPSKAAGLTIRGHVVTEDEQQKNVTVVKYTGTLKASCDVTFEDIYLTEGKTNKEALDGFAETGSITPAPANYKTITFTDSVFTVENDEAIEKRIEDALIFASVNSSKGEIVLDNSSVTVNGAMSIGTLQLEDGIAVDAGGKISVTNLYTDEEDNRLSSPSTITISNVVNSALKDMDDAGLTDGSTDDDTDGRVIISTCFTKIKKAGTYGTSQLTISGLINDAKVQIEPMSYDLTSASYQEMTREQIENLLVGTAVKPDGYRRFALIPKASLKNVVLVAKDATTYSEYSEEHSGNTTQKYLYKYDTGLYLTNLLPMVEVVGYTTCDETDAYATYSGACYNARFLSWDQAVKEIDKIGNKYRYYEMILLDTIGYDDGKISGPIGTVTMPAKVAQVMITSEEGEENGIFFTGSTITAKCPTLLKNVGFTRVKQYGKGVSAYFAPITFTYNIGNYHVIMTDMAEEFCGEETVPCSVSGSSKGILECSTAQKDVNDNVTYTSIKNISDLVVTEDMAVNCEGDLSVKNLIVTEGSVSAKNVAVSTKTTLDEAYIQAGTDASGTGKMTFKDIALTDSGNRLTAKQDKNGKSMITINGTVTMENNLVELEADNILAIKLLYNNSPMAEGKQKPVQMYNGLILCTAQKAASNLFSPVYTVSTEAEQTELTNGNPIYAVRGMGKKISGYGVYKLGKTICYGTVPSNAEVVLHIGDGHTYSYFATFEEAVAEINSLSLYKDATAKTKEYEDYKIELLSDVEIGNAKKNNSYSSLSLPTKVKNLTIVGSDDNETASNCSLYFAGNVSAKSNTAFKDINLYPIKAVKGKAVKTAVNYSIGNYRLVMDNVYSSDENGTSLLGNISGSSKTGAFELIADIAEEANPEYYQVGINQISGLRQIVLNEYTRLQITKTCNVYEVIFNRHTEEGIPELSVDGAITLTQIVGRDVEEVVPTEEAKQYGFIHKPVSSKLTLKGAYEKRTGDTAKNYYSIILPDTNSMIVIDLEGAACPTGTLVLTGSYLDWNVIQSYIEVINTIAMGEYYNCSTYTGGKNLFVGKKV